MAQSNSCHLSLTFWFCVHFIFIFNVHFDPVSTLKSAIFLEKNPYIILVFLKFNYNERHCNVCLFPPYPLFSLQLKIFYIEKMCFSGLHSNNTQINVYSKFTCQPHFKPLPIAPYIRVGPLCKPRTEVLTRKWTQAVPHVGES